jgi:hypothetical protein
VPIARKMLLQVAARDIGQLTDFGPWHTHRSAYAPATCPFHCRPAEMLLTGAPWAAPSSVVVPSKRQCGQATWMQNMGTAQDRRCLPRLLCLSTVAQGRGCALRLLYFAAVRRSSRVGRDHLIRRQCRACSLPAHSTADLPKQCSLVRSSRQC